MPAMKRKTHRSPSYFVSAQSLVSPDATYALSVPCRLVVFWHFGICRE